MNEYVNLLSTKYVPDIVICAENIAVKTITKIPPLVKLTYILVKKEKKATISKK